MSKVSNDLIVVVKGFAEMTMVFEDIVKKLQKLIVVLYNKTIAMGSEICVRNALDVIDSAIIESITL